MDSGFYVYRFLNMDNKVLYVGRTHNLDQRFINHTHLTKHVEKIEYITCDTEIEMVIKEIYYINLYYNELSTNERDVYDKPTNFSFTDKWNLYKKLPAASDYEKIYVIRLTFSSVYFDMSNDAYFTGKYDNEGLPKTTDDPLKARRYSDIKHVKQIVKKIHNTYEKINEKISYEIINGNTSISTFCVNIYPEIFMEREISHYLYEYYSTNRTRSKQLYFEDIALNSKQNHIFADCVSIDGQIIKNVLYDKEWNALEKQRYELRKDPDWEDHIWDEEFVCYYIKNNCDLDKAFKEIISDRKKGITLKKNLNLMPLGYRNPGDRLNHFVDPFDFDEF